MSDTLFVSTRKGFTVSREAGRWEIGGVDFLGDNVSITLTGPRDGGIMRLSITVISASSCTARQRRVGRKSRRPRILPSRKATRNTTCGAGLSPGARHAFGRSRQAVSKSPAYSGAEPSRAVSSARPITATAGRWSLWDHPKRTQWMGGGADLPGMHSICVDPRNAKRVCVAVSTGGLWFTEDAGASWSERGEGMRAEYVPPS